MPTLILAKIPGIFNKAQMPKNKGSRKRYTDAEKAEMLEETEKALCERLLIHIELSFLLFFIRFTALQLLFLLPLYLPPAVWQTHIPLLRSRPVR